MNDEVPPETAPLCPDNKLIIACGPLAGTRAPQLGLKLEEIEMKYDERFRIVFEAIQQLTTPPERPRKRIGFEVKEGRAKYGKRAKGKKSKS
jgi:hypothetical protein